MSLYVTGDVSAPQRESVESHLSGCGACRSAVAQAFEWERQSRPAIRSFRTGRWAWAAAAGLLIALGGVGAWRSLRGQAAPSPAGDFPPASARSVTGIHERLDRTGTVRLPDGSWVRAGEDTAARFIPPVEGERAHLVLEHGELEAFVAKGNGVFQVETSSGTVRVLGTRFIVRALSFGARSPDESFRLGEAVCVEVQDGRVALSSAAGEVFLPVGSRGVSFPGAEPLKLEQAGTWDRALEQFAQVLDLQSDPLRIRPDRTWAAQLLAASYWGSQSRVVRDWATRITQASSPDRRAAAAVWVGLGAPPGAAEALKQVFETETDPKVRPAIRKALECLGGE